MRSMIAAVAIAVAMGSTAMAAAPHCTKGKVCGNTCIAANAVCKITPPKAPQCKTGKLCGNTCVAKTAVCHK